MPLATGGWSGSGLSSPPPIAPASSAAASSMKFKAILSIFSSQYSNSTAESWTRYVNEINSRTVVGSMVFLMFMDGDKVVPCSYISVSPGSGDSSRGELTVATMHNEAHKEPLLRRKHVEESCCSNKFQNHRWEILRDSKALKDVVKSIDVKIDHPMVNYINAISYVVLKKKISKTDAP